jgi:hypothetical protein
VSTEIVKQEEANLFIYARNSAEMVAAQERTIKGFESKLAVEKVRKDELEENLRIAKKNKWKVSVIANNVRYAQNRVEFYEKVLAALKAGFQIIPDMDVDVFAIRTSKGPRANQVTSKVTTWSDGATPKDQKTDSPPVGEGENVSTTAAWDESRGSREIVENNEKKTIENVTRWAVEHGEVEFPFQLVKPQILDMTAKAMKKKIFDEFGVLPRRRASVDPVVVGRITLKGRPEYNRKSVNFMVAWFLDLKDL